MVFDDLGNLPSVMVRFPAYQLLRMWVWQAFLERLQANMVKLYLRFDVMRLFGESGLVSCIYIGKYIGYVYGRAYCRIRTQ